MSTGKEIRQKIASVKNTQKITKAMEMVSTSKMRKTQLNMNAARPYADNIYRIIAHICNANSEHKSPLMEQRSADTIGLIIVSSDRGLCGGLNSNLFRHCLKTIKQWKDEGKKVKMALLGSKAITFFKIIGGDIFSAQQGLGDSPHISTIKGTVNSVLQEFSDGNIDQLMVASNKFVNTVTQEPNIIELLPLHIEHSQIKQGGWDYLYEPDAESVLDELIKRYIENLIYKSVVENIACEQAARMLAMKNATDNASNMIDSLNLAYNKARQAAITQELSEIIGGAAAV